MSVSKKVIHKPLKKVVRDFVKRVLCPRLLFTYGDFDHRGFCLGDPSMRKFAALLETFSQLSSTTTPCSMIRTHIHLIVSDVHM